MAAIDPLGAAWPALLALRRHVRDGAPPPAGFVRDDDAWRYTGRAQPDQAPLIAALAQVAGAPGRLAIGQLGQSLDGRIATRTGHSHYINGADARAHLHRLRALCDAVLVGAGTVVADDPRLTVRLVDGPDPVRVVIDPHRRCPADRAVFGDGPPTWVMTAATGARKTGRADVVALPDTPRAILDALAARGCRVVLVEGGAVTVSRFLDGGALDRLHLLIAPLLIGSGRPGLDLPPIDTLAAARRPPVNWIQLGREMLADLDLIGARVGPDAGP